MADGVSIDQVAAQYGGAQAAPSAGVSIDDLANQYNQPSQGVPIDQMAQNYGAPSVPGVKPEIAQAMQNPFPTGQQFAGSPVGKFLAPLAVPLRAESGMVAGALGLGEKLNPEGKVVPDIFLSDITNIYMDKAAQAVDKAVGRDPTQSDYLTYAYEGAKTGLGLAANVIGDPLSWVGLEVGQLTDEAQQARKIGDFSNTERNAVSVQPGIPLTDIKTPKLALPADPVVNAAKTAADATKTVVSKLPGGQGALDLAAKGANAAKNLVSALDYKTGNPYLDMKMTEHAGLVRGDANQLHQDFIAPNLKKNYSEAENTLIGRLVENTPNVAPNVPETIINAAGSPPGPEILKTIDAANKEAKLENHYKYIEQFHPDDIQDTIKNEPGLNFIFKNDRAFDPYHGNVSPETAEPLAKALEKRFNEPIPTPKQLKSPGSKFAPSEESVATQMYQRAANLGVDLGLTPDKMVPGRMESIIDTAMDIKRQNAADLEERFAAGLLTDENAGQKVMENYLVHKANPAYVKLNPRLAVAKTEATLADEMSKTASGTFISKFDPGSYSRKIKGSIEEANQIMKDKVGVSDYFITDPVVATAMKRLETRKLLRDSNLLDAVGKFGVPKPFAKANGLDYVGIPHPQFAGKAVEIHEPSGNVKSMTLDQLVFPKEIANKMTYYMVPRQIGNFPAYLDSCNRTFRDTALFSPGYYGRNYLENIAKNYVQGVKVQDYVDTAKAMTGKGMIEINGKQLPASQIKELVDRLGINSGGQFREGISDALGVGKKITFNLNNTYKHPILVGKEAIKSLVGPVFDGLRHAGEKGENFTRSALFINRLKSGYIPEMAAVEVEKFLFDFTRNSQTTDAIRRFSYPFIQHALKTAFIAPEMLGKSAATYNFIHNTALKTVANAFNDPVRQEELEQLIPGYRKFQDVVAGPLMPGNTWLAGIFGNEKAQGQMGKLVYFKSALGMDILNRFAFFSDQMASEGYGLNPLLHAFAGAVTGKDPFTHKDVDIDPNNPKAVARLNYFISNALENQYALPNTMKMIKQAFGIGDPRYFEPTALLMLKGSFGQFGGVIDLDREFLFRQMAFAHARKELITKLASATASEAQGKTLDIRIANAPDIVKKAYGAIKPSSSAEVFNTLLGQQIDLQKSQVARGAILGNYNPAQVASMIKNLDETMKNSNDNYRALKQRYFEMAKGAKDAEEAKALIGQDMAKQLGE